VKNIIGFFTFTILTLSGSTTLLDLDQENFIPPMPRHVAQVRFVLATVTAYHSELCAQGDLVRGKTATGKSACNELGIAVGSELLHRGALIYLSGFKIKNHWRVPDDFCEECQLAEDNQQLWLDLRLTTKRAAQKFGRKQIWVLIVDK